MLSRLLRALPLPWALAVGRAFAFVWYHFLPVRRGVARRNVRRALGAELTPRQQRQVVRQCFANLGMYGVESLRLPSLTPDSVRSLVRFTGQEHYDAALARGRGVILVGSHFGSFDLFCCAHAVLRPPLYVVMKDIKWGEAQRFWRQVRQASGIVPIAPRRSKEEIKAALQAGHTLAFPSDQHMAPHRAIVCEFFGMLASTTPAAARFAYETGAAIVPVVMFRQDNQGHHLFRYCPELELESPHAELQANIRHNTERLNRIIEGWIREAPAQWLWLHKRWKVQDDPTGWDIPPHLRHLLHSRIG